MLLGLRLGTPTRTECTSFSKGHLLLFQEALHRCTQRKARGTPRRCSRLHEPHAALLRHKLLLCWLSPACLSFGRDRQNTPSPPQQSHLIPGCINSSPLSFAEECFSLEKAILFQPLYQALILVLSSSGTFSARTFPFWQIVSEKWENMMLICLCLGYYE